MRNTTMVWVQVALVVSMSITFSYLIGESEKQEGEGRWLAEAVAFIGSMLFGSEGFVSAVNADDVRHTCVKTKAGESCQEYPAQECAAKCSESCVPSKRENVAACKLGTCYNARDGVCQTGASQSMCASKGGEWFDDTYGNIAQCRKGCCLLGGKAQFVTEQQCTRSAGLLGMKREFRTDVKTELACLALAAQQEEGACVFVQEHERTCLFSTKAQCVQRGGEFYSGILCSNEALKTSCKPQATTACATASDGTSKVYWFDSCGNRENIFDYAKRVELQQLGKVIAANESCVVGKAGDVVANVRTCGNCNYLLGSKCGRATEQEKAAIGDVVCKDLSCVDENGNKRKHGESWCQYQGAVGVDDAKNRGMDTPGSRHFRKVCVNGEARTEPCADARTEMCVESKTPIDGGGTFSSAACRVNLAYTCYAYNTPEKKEECMKNPDCFVKKVSVGDKFVFDVCAPKVKPGFLWSERGQGSAALCSLASQKCTAVYVKGLGGWKCKANCACEKAEFAEQLNDLCISLGDCGSQVNYEGVYSENSRASSSKGGTIGMSALYLQGLTAYARPVPGKAIEARDVGALYQIIGIPEGLGQAEFSDTTAASVKLASHISGAAGIMLVAGAYITGFTAAASGYGTLGALGSFFSGVAAATPGVQGIAVGAASVPAMQAAGGVLAGAATAVAVVSMLLQFTGVGKGLPPAFVYALLATSAIAGGIIGANIGANIVAGGSVFGSFSGGLASAAAASWIFVGVVIVAIVIMKLLGIGKTKQVTVSFSCKPWQAPPGGAHCVKCGADGLPCSRYACESLGQLCELINEQSEKPECVAIAANDTAPPVLSFNHALLTANYTAEKFENGVKIKSREGDGCIQETYTPLVLGVVLNEPGQCRVSTNTSGVRFEEMDDFGSTFYTRNHSLPFVLPSLESEGLEGFDPRARLDTSLYVRCRDKTGNVNEKDFAIALCVKQGLDVTPARVVKHEPAPSIARADATSINITLFTNEPAECRWDTQDSDYALMKNAFSCMHAFEERTLEGWRCAGEVGVSEQEQTVSVRCLDQPWLEEQGAENSSRRNANSESYNFTVRRSASPLVISSVTPDNQQIVVGSEPASITLAATTSGGIDGTARCSYSWNGANFSEFRKGSWTTTHQQVFQFLYSGSYRVPLRCVDAVGHVVERTAQFSVVLDTDAPEITRVYQDNGRLLMVTNEQAQCVVSSALPGKDEDGCAYAWANGTSMGAEGTRHSVPWKAGASYFIKCKDRFGHGPGTACSVVVRT